MRGSTGRRTSISVRRWWSADVQVPVPGPVRQFIRQFGSGAFTFLVAAPDAEPSRPTLGSS